MKTKHDNRQKSKNFSGPNKHWYAKSEEVVKDAKENGPSEFAYRALQEVCSALASDGDRFGLAIAGLKNTAKLKGFELSQDGISSERRQTLALEGLDLLKRSEKLLVEMDVSIPPSLIKWELIFRTHLSQAHRESGNHEAATAEQKKALQLGFNACRRYPNYVGLQLAYLKMRMLATKWTSRKLLLDAQRLHGLALNARKVSEEDMLQIQQVSSFTQCHFANLFATNI